MLPFINRWHCLETSLEFAIPLCSWMRAWLAAIRRSITMPSRITTSDCVRLWVSCWTNPSCPWMRSQLRIPANNSTGTAWPCSMPSVVPPTIQVLLKLSRFTTDESLDSFAQQHIEIVWNLVFLLYLSGKSILYLLL